MYMSQTVQADRKAAYLQALKGRSDPHSYENEKKPNCSATKTRNWAVVVSISSAVN